MRSLVSILLIASKSHSFITNDVTFCRLSSLDATLKPAAVPLMEAGKRFARSGEFLIDLSTSEDLYGGALSAVGAQIRNSGDCIAQAAASCRFKTGTELVIDELREAGTCLKEGYAKMSQATEEAKVDQRSEWISILERGSACIKECSDALEAAGAAILKKQTVEEVGGLLCEAGSAAEILSAVLLDLGPTKQEARDAAERMNAASEQLKLAGNELRGIMPEAPKGKTWLKGGL